MCNSRGCPRNVDLTETALQNLGSWTGRKQEVNGVRERVSGKIANVLVKCSSIRQFRSNVKQTLKSLEFQPRHP